MPTEIKLPAAAAEMKLFAQGEPNAYAVLDNGHWVAHVLMNGEMSVAQQVEILKGWLSDNRDTRIAELEAEQNDVYLSLSAAWIAEFGSQMPWGKAVEMSAILTKMTDAERDRLLALDFPDILAERDALKAELATIKAQESNRIGWTVRGPDGRLYLSDYATDYQDEADNWPLIDGFTVVPVYATQVAKQVVMPELSEIISRFPEINMANYGDDEVSALNNWGIELVLTFNAADHVEGVRTMVEAKEPVIDEQAAFEDWIARVCPGGDCSSVHDQWLSSSDYEDLYATPVTPTDEDYPTGIDSEGGSHD